MTTQISKAEAINQALAKHASGDPVAAAHLIQDHLVPRWLLNDAWIALRDHYAQKFDLTRNEAIQRASRSPEGIALRSLMVFASGPGSNPAAVAQKQEALDRVHKTSGDGAFAQATALAKALMSEGKFAFIEAARAEIWKRRPDLLRAYETERKNAINARFS